MEKLKRHTLNGSSLEWVLASDVEALEAAKREDEARIAGLQLSLEMTQQHRLNLLNQRGDLQSQLTAEQQAHEETKRQLVDGLNELLKLSKGE